MACLDGLLEVEPRRERGVAVVVRRRPGRESG